MTGDAARVVRPQRDRIGWEMVDVDALLEQEHAVRLAWAFVTRMDLAKFYAAIGSRAGGAGRPAAEWLFAAVEGVGQAA